MIQDGQASASVSVDVAYKEASWNFLWNIMGKQFGNFAHDLIPIWDNKEVAQLKPWCSGIAKQSRFCSPAAEAFKIGI